MNLNSGNEEYNGMMLPVFDDEPEPPVGEIPVSRNIVEREPPVGETPDQSKEYLAAMGCLIELAKKYGVYVSKNQRTLYPEQPIEHLFTIIRYLLSKTPKETSKLFKNMKDARDSISLERMAGRNDMERMQLGRHAIDVLDVLLPIKMSFFRFYKADNNTDLLSLSSAWNQTLEIYDCLISTMKQLHPRLNMLTNEDRKIYRTHLFEGGSNKKRKSIKRKSIKNKKRKSTKKKKK